MGVGSRDRVIQKASKTGWRIDRWMTEGTGWAHRLAEEEKSSLRGRWSPFSTIWAAEGDMFSVWSGECVREWQDGGMQDREESVQPRRAVVWQTAAASDKQSALREEWKAYCFCRLQLLTPAPGPEPWHDHRHSLRVKKGNFTFKIPEWSEFLILLQDLGDGNLTCNGCRPSD